MFVDRFCVTVPDSRPTQVISMWRRLLTSLTLIESLGDYLTGSFRLVWLVSTYVARTVRCLWAAVRGSFGPGLHTVRSWCVLFRKRGLGCGLGWCS